MRGSDGPLPLQRSQGFCVSSRFALLSFSADSFLERKWWKSLWGRWKAEPCIRAELKPRTRVSYGGLTFSCSSLPLLSAVPGVDPLHKPPLPPAPVSPSLLQPPQRTISKRPPLSMALSGCELTAIKCQIKLMARHWQGAEAYTTQWIIVMEQMMSWLLRSVLLLFILSLFWKEENTLFSYLYVSLMMSRLLKKTN